MIMNKNSLYQKGWIIALVVICVLSFSLMIKSSFGESAIMDELAHIPAGYGYVHNLDYRLNPEHPPLLKSLAAFPLLFMDLNFPTADPAWQSEINSQWTMGTKFIYESGNNADAIVRTSRLAPILITLLLVILVYFWSRELMGSYWALLPALFSGLSPTILAHGHYVTTDVAAAFGTALSTYFFLKFLMKPSKMHLLYAGLAFGIAELLKFSTVLLIPYFIGLMVIFYLVKFWKGRGQTGEPHYFSKLAWKYFRALILVFVIGYVIVVYPVYFLFTYNYPQARQTSDTTTILTSFANGPAPAGQMCKGMRCAADLDIWMTKNQVTRPVAQYMLGVLMVFQRADGGNTNYFLGTVSAAGSHIYFPVVYLLKEPLPVILLALFALCLAIWGMIRVKNKKTALLYYLENNFSTFALIFFVAFYWAYSMNSTLNIGVRHLMPTVPFIYILTVAGLKRWVSRTKESAEIPVSSINMGERVGAATSYTLKIGFILLMIIWFLIEVAIAYPNFLSYFNEVGGGKWNGYKYVVDSNYDWGQDMLRFSEWLPTHPEINKIAVDYFGGASQSYYLDGKTIDWNPGKGNPADQGIHWFAISINNLQNSLQPIVQNYTRESSYDWLVQLKGKEPGMGGVPKPDYRIGTTIFVYHI